MRITARTLGSMITLMLAATACEESGGERTEAEIASTVMAAEVPESLGDGAAAFEANCASCHGERGLGTASGPPLIHIIYEPSHHGDIAFVMAAERGVRAHHWGFGDMPPVPNVSREQVSEITEYIRHLQREVGIE